MRTDKVKVVAALGMMVGAALIFYVSTGEAPPKFELRPEEGLGQVLAEAAVKALGGGGRLIVITRDTSNYKTPAIEAQERGFYRTLQEAKLSAAATNVIKLDPLRVVRVPPGDYVEILRKKSESDVVVSFLGPPVLDGDQKSKLDEKRPRILAVCSGDMPRQVDLKELFDQNLLHLAIVSRPVPAPSGPASASAREAFDRIYQVVNASNFAEFSSLLGGAARPP